jgi:hypothetical protein
MTFRIVSFKMMAQTSNQEGERTGFLRLLKKRVTQWHQSCGVKVGRWGIGKLSVSKVHQPEHRDSFLRRKPDERNSEKRVEWFDLSSN